MRLLATLGPCALLGLLVAGCQPAPPPLSRWAKLLTDPGVTQCDPTAADSACDACVKQACCSERYVCLVHTHVSCDVFRVCAAQHCAEQCRKELSQ